MAQADHHGKRFSRMKTQGGESGGEKLLNWRYTVMNEIGQVAIAVNTETCSYAAASSIAREPPAARLPAPAP